MLRIHRTCSTRVALPLLLLPLLLLLTLALPALADETAEETESVDPAGVFEELKSLAGTWEGAWAGEGEGTEEESEGPGARHIFRVASAGTVVMETMNEGTDHEMINMYHLVDDDLVITHYCAGGNQPLLKLDVERSAPDRLVFDFAGGTNVDPAVDPHIHAMELEIEGDHIVSHWTGYNQGEAVSSMSFDLARN